MKRNHATLKLLSLIAFGGFSMGCSTVLQERENLAIEAGFKVVAPVKADQQAILAKLQTGKVIEVSYHGKTYYVLPDPKNSQAYVGGPKEYQAYRQLRAAKNLSIDEAQKNENAAMDWGAWGGATAPGLQR